jgi:hypothetical protein
VGGVIARRAQGDVFEVAGVLCRGVVRSLMRVSSVVSRVCGSVRRALGQKEKVWECEMAAWAEVESFELLKATHDYIVAFDPAPTVQKTPFSVGA